MDIDAVQRQLNVGKLVVGDVRETCCTFFQTYSPAPIGAILHDLDYYSSTSNSFSIFDTDSSNFLPRVFMYFDDIVGGTFGYQTIIPENDSRSTNSIESTS